MDRPSGDDPTIIQPTEDVPADEQTRDLPRTTQQIPGQRFSPGSSLGGRYRIISLLGRGGMGEVYRADDLLLGEPVALKFFAAGAPSGKSMERVLSEVKLARTITHPNVCRVHDVVQLGEELFIAMEYIDGEDLSALLRRIGKLPVPKSVAIGRDIAAGLAAAHHRGVVHRDLKPGNVMLDSKGAARVTDFGLAVMNKEARRPVAGTPAYMAPEQLAGAPADVRSDIYAFGVVMWEILTGERLYGGSTLGEILLLHSKPKPSLSTFSLEIDADIDSLVRRCLAEEPRHRPQSMEEVLSSLPAASSSQQLVSRPTPRSQELERSIAVLPFTDLSPNRDQEYFSDGMTEEIIAALSRLRGLRVTSRTSAMRFKGSERDARAIAAELNTAYLLEGSVRKAGMQVRITAQLIDARQDSHLWAESYTGTLEDVFSIQEKVAQAIVRELEIKLTPREASALAQRAIPDQHAYELYLQARAGIRSFDRASLQRAIEQTREAIALAGDNELLYATLGYAFWQLVNSGFEPDRAQLRLAEDCVRRIEDIHPGSHHAARLRGLIQFARGDIRATITEFEHVLRSDPNDADTLIWLGTALAVTGHGERARSVADRLLQIDPLNSQVSMLRALVAQYDGHFDLAEESFRRFLQVEGDHPVVWFLRMNLHAARGDRDRAVALAGEAPPVESPFCEMGNLLAAALSGRAVEISEEITAFAAPDPQYTCWLAEILAAAGRTDQALDELEKAVRSWFTPHLYLARHDRLLDPLRGDSRFAELLALARRRSEELL